MQKYSENNLKFVFTFKETEGIELPVCVICSDMLSNEEYFQAHLKSLKGQQTLMRQSAKVGELALKASYQVALQSAQNKKPYTIAEDLILPAVSDMCKTTFGNDEYVNKLKNIPLSDTTIGRRIDDMASDVRVQLVEKLRLAEAFTLQLDESTDMSNDAQLLVFVRALRTRLFSSLCAAAGEEHTALLYHSGVQWLSRGTVQSCMFELRDELGDSAVLLLHVTRTIVPHLEALKGQSRKYFSETPGAETRHGYISIPFKDDAADVSNLKVTEEDQLIEVSTDSTYRNMYETRPLIQFWISCQKDFPQLTAKAMRSLLCFAMTYLCESGFSTLTYLKSKYRSRLQPEADMALCLTTSNCPRIDKLFATHQGQSSH
ncbi:SCND3 protein, partial [Amia calva]|nr:SCND3 protein [Amia calva]